MNDPRNPIAQAVDALGHPNPDATKTLGFTIVCQYLRNTSLQIIEGDLAADLGVLLIDEHTATESLMPPSAWAARADAVVAECRAYNVPAGVAPFATADTGIRVDQWPIVEAGWREYGPRLQAAGLRRGYYCGEQLGDHLLDIGLIDFLWGVGATSWDGKDPDGSIHFSSRAALRQLVAQINIAGTTCDINNVFVQDCGQWSTAAPTPPVPPPTPENQMLEIVKFPDKLDLWLHGYTQDPPGDPGTPPPPAREFFAPIASTDDIDPHFNLPVRMLSSGDDDLDARFKRITGL